MEHAIRIDDHLSVIVVFAELPVLRLTPRGLFRTHSMQALVLNARGLAPLGAGMSIRSNDDDYDMREGMKHALSTALHEAFPGDKEARTIVFEHYLGTIRKLGEEPIFNLKTGQLLSEQEAFERDPIGTFMATSRGPVGNPLSV